MRHRTEQWSKMAARGRFRMNAKARIGNKDYFSISAPKINRSLMTTPLSVGNCISATMTLSMLTDDELIAKRPITIMGRLESDGKHSEWMEFGTFYINQRDTSYEGLVTIECYDAMLKTNQQYLETDDTSDWPKTMLDVVSEIAFRIGVGIDPRTRINTGDDYMVPAPTGKTMMQVLGYIGACHGGNWIITEENLLRLVPLITSPGETFHIIDENFEKIKAGDGSLLAYRLAEESVTLPKPTGEIPDSKIVRTYYVTDKTGQRLVTSDGHYLVWAANGSADAVDGLINVPVVCGNLVTGTAVTIGGVLASNESGDTYAAGDRTGYVLSIESNPYVTQGICDDLHAAFCGLVYEPYTATKACYDPAAELGDQVKIGDKVCSVLYSANFRFDVDFRADISAPNSDELSSEYPFLSLYQQLLQSTHSMNASIKENADKITESLESANLDLENLSTALQEEIKRASDVETKLSTRIGEVDGRLKTVEEKVTKIDEHDSTLASHQQKLDSIQSESQRIDLLQISVDDLEARVDALETKVSTLITTVDSHTQLLTDIQAQLERLSGNT